MKVEATVKFTYTINDDEVAKFKSRVIDYIQEETDWDCDITLNEISDNDVEAFLSGAILDAIEEKSFGNNYGSGIIIDDYFQSIWFDYYEEDVRDMVSDMAHQIYASIKEV